MSRCSTRPTLISTTSFMQPLPIALRNLQGTGSLRVKRSARARGARIRLRRAVRIVRNVPGRGFVGLLSPLHDRPARCGVGQPPAVHEGYRSILPAAVPAQGDPRVVSYLGSHLLSLAYLVLFGRYISDTLSGVRAVRDAFLTRLPVAPDDKLANQYLLSALLAEKADILETPVQFLPLSPERVRRTTLVEGLRSLAIIAWQRLARSTTRRRSLRRLDAGRSESVAACRNPDTVLIIPAAGAGTRLQASTPKVLVPVNGRPMIDYLIDLYRPVVRRSWWSMHPSVEAASGRTARRRVGTRRRVCTQAEPTGMLDAILLARRGASAEPTDVSGSHGAIRSACT